MNPYDTGRFAEVEDLDGIRTRLDVAEVVQRMREDLLAHPGEWENPTLERFLDALAAVLEGLPGRYTNRGERFPELPTWKILAEALVAASGYE
jgi:hypothetical protein